MTARPCRRSWRSTSRAAAASTTTRTIYCGTFSKTLSPGLRVGWICAAAAVIRKLVLMKQASDLHSPTINQMVMHHVAEHAFDGQVEKLRGAYRQRRDAHAGGAGSATCRTACTWTRPEGGMFVWVTLPEGIDGAELLARSVETARVAFVPGRPSMPTAPARTRMRLSFSLRQRRGDRRGHRAAGEGDTGGDVNFPFLPLRGLRTCSASARGAGRRMRGLAALVG